MNFSMIYDVVNFLRQYFNFQDESKQSHNALTVSSFGIENVHNLYMNKWTFLDTDIEYILCS